MRHCWPKQVVNKVAQKVEVAVVAVVVVVVVVVDFGRVDRIGDKDSK